MTIFGQRLCVCEAAQCSVLSSSFFQRSDANKWETKNCMRSYVNLCLNRYHLSIQTEIRWRKGNKKIIKSKDGWYCIFSYSKSTWFVIIVIICGEWWLLLLLLLLVAFFTQWILIEYESVDIQQRLEIPVWMIFQLFKFLCERINFIK